MPREFFNESDLEEIISAMTSSRYLEKINAILAITIDTG
jgi:hypothetical protein